MAPRTATDTRERIVDAARELFWEQGFEATSLAQIAKRSQARTGSIYYFFKTKTEILDAVLAHYEDQLGAWLLDPVFRRTSDPLERIFGVLDTYRAFLLETHFSLGCPVGGLAVELSNEYTDARARLGRVFDGLTGALEACVRDLELRSAPEPPVVAALVMSVIEGGIVQARATRRIEPFDHSVTALRDYFRRLVD